jgi:hypothetical protein
MKQPVGVSGNVQVLSELERVANPAPPELDVHVHDSPRQNPESDAARSAQECRSQWAAGFVPDRDDRSIDESIEIDHVVPEDPEMTRTDPLHTLFAPHPLWSIELEPPSPR